jgi:hypothetical protein
MKDGNGSKVIVPFPFTVYVPSPLTVSEFTHEAPETMQVRAASIEPWEVAGVTV